MGTPEEDEVADTADDELQMVDEDVDREARSGEKDDEDITDADDGERSEDDKDVAAGAEEEESEETVISAQSPLLYMTIIRTPLGSVNTPGP
jgi:hypothetical protein